MRAPNANVFGQGRVAGTYSYFPYVYESFVLTRAGYWQPDERELAACKTLAKKQAKFGKACTPALGGTIHYNISRAER